MSLRCAITGVGAYLPQRVMPNKEFESLVDTTEEWILERTGIRTRHIASPEQRTSDLGAEAARAALRNAGRTAQEIDLIIVATTTPDETMPATALRIQHKLGVTRGAAFDLSAACSGFVYALTTADALIKAGQATRALVIGAETYSRIVDWKDRSTCILFGDGAGAAVLEASASEAGLLASRLHADGRHGDLLSTSGGVCATQTAGTIRMAGKEVFRHAVAKMSESVLDALQSLGMTTADVAWLVPHQANARILAGVAKALNIGEERVVSTVERHANTSAASIPLALAEAENAGKLRSGQVIALTALGAGLTWGACIIRW